jgi:glyoxylase-like metal-dependent hydrolase (beta-lactamase superfamily II)/8-oxo-dGTP pyrophosphatase MutT (NUDIX family)
VSSSGLYENVLSRLGERFDKPTSAKPRTSASVAPWRRGADGEIEVYWVRRSPMLRFMGGWRAFPGGGLAAEDLETPVRGVPRGIDTPFEMDDVPGADAELPPNLVDGLTCCVLRELFEETGILVTTDDSEVPARPRAEQARREMLDQQTPFPRILGELGVTLDGAKLVYAGRWVTPPFSTIRFDARFFLLEWPEERALQPTIIKGELDQGEWIRPAEAIQRWRRGEALLAQPLLHILRVMLRDGPENGIPLLLPGPQGPTPNRIEFRREISAVPLRTDTLPPATHTSAYLLGRQEMVLIDPGSGAPDQLESLKRVIRDAGKRENGIVKAIWLTHHHPDHIGGVQAMRRELGVPVCAHPLTAERLEKYGIEVDQPLLDGQTIILAGDPPVSVSVLHTPGHARGHLCFYEQGSASLIAGDMVASNSTIVIDPPEGDMDAYLHSLSRLIALQPNVLLPAHGSMIANAVDRLQALYDHRLRREQAVLDAWKKGLRDTAEMVPEVYADISEREYPLAERQIQAHIERLRKLGSI